MTDRIGAAVAHLEGRKLMIPFFTAGYPDRTTTVRLVRTAADAGADMVELGMPFSDPLADGPEIQLTSHESLKRGTNLTKVLDTVESLRKAVDVPLILMGYFNPLLAFGIREFVRSAAAAGADGYIIPDLPVEDAVDMQREAERLGQSMVYLAAPTTTRARLTVLDVESTHFVYAVTVTGVTGTGNRFDPSTDRYMRQLRRMLSKPFVAGFGVSSPESARRLARFADGVVIGSALVRCMREARTKAAGEKAVGRLLRGIRKAI